MYGFILLGLVLAWGWGVTHRTDLITEVLRDRNALYREVGDGVVENSHPEAGQQAHDNRYRITLKTDTPGYSAGRRRIHHASRCRAGAFAATAGLRTRQHPWPP